MLFPFCRRERRGHLVYSTTKLHLTQARTKHVERLLQLKMKALNRYKISEIKYASIAIASPLCTHYSVGRFHGCCQNSELANSFV